MKIYIYDDNGTYITSVNGIDDNCAGKPEIRLAICTKIPLPITADMQSKEMINATVITLKMRRIKRENNWQEEHDEYILDNKDHAAFRKHMEIKKQLKHMAAL